MEILKLENFTKGWIIGNFSPTLLPTEDFEIAIKNYKKGDKEAEHYHKIATEFTILASGEAIMLGKTFKAGDIIRIDPGDKTSFECIEDCITVVVKTPSVPDDKYSN